ncbi:hypothetical protein DFQ28_006061 [Apophysomyces sp. BC1034]|nr:hypothetical protein DFQ28_006061 [Apophysomyces sp. BC1034]
MFRFDPFRKSPSPSISNSVNSSGANADEEQQSIAERPTGLLRRVTNPDASVTSITPHSVMKRPSLSSLSKSISSSSSSISSSFSIPIPANSWGMLMLSRLRDTNDSEIDDIVDLLLVQDKAMLLLPVSRPSHPSAVIDREFIQDHVILHQNNHDMAQVMSLSGIRGAFQKDRLVALGLLPPERERSSIVESANKRSLFDAFNLDPSSITADHPAYTILASHVQLPLRDDKTITTMLIQKPISKADVVDWVRSRQHSDTNLAAEVPSDIPMASQVAVFIKTFLKKRPRTPDEASVTIMDFLDDIRPGITESSDNVEDSLDTVESFICSKLYDCLFPEPKGDEYLADEALASRIAALSLLDLSLEHLGVILNDPAEIDSINEAFKAAGIQLQKLISMTSAKEKIETLVKTHEIIVESLENKYREETEIGITSKVEQNASSVSQSNQLTITEAHVPLENSTGKQNERDSDAEKIDNSPSTVLEPVSSGRKLDTDRQSTNSLLAEIPDSILAKPMGNESDSLPDEKANVDHQKLGLASADVLLPLLIFTIVKSNPPHILSNLRFIQRFRRPSMISGQSSYCLTNMMAAVSFLETTNFAGLGLSADRVHLTELNVSEEAKIRASSGLRQNPMSGLKLMSEVMDSSYRVFDGIGRLWQRNTDGEGSLAPGSKTAKPSSNQGKHSSMMEEMIGKVRLVSESVKKEPSELKETINNQQRKNSASSGSTGITWENAVPSFMESRVASLRQPTSRTDTFHALLQAPSNFIQSVTPRSTPHPADKDGPIQKFLDMKSVDDLTIGDVTQLLADYKRLAAILKQSGAV